MAKLTADQLKALPDEMFGLPKTRQYPMPDKAHVIKAIQFFKYCKDEDKPELAKNINRRAKELGMKIKVQPSSAFYKYADKTILKEATLVQEFHIGQLAPIVTLEPQVIKMNFGNGKREDAPGPIERLNALWGSQKSLNTKAVDTAAIVHEAVSSQYRFNANEVAILAGIDSLSYMTRKWEKTTESSLSDRLYDHCNECYSHIQEYIDEHRLDDIVNLINSMTTRTEYACVLGILSYTMALSDDEKNYIFSKTKFGQVNLDGIVSSDNIAGMNKQVVPMKVGMTDNDIFHVDQFVNMLNGKYLIMDIAMRIAGRRFGDELIFITGNNIENDSHSVTSQLRYIELADKIPSYGFYRKFINDRSFMDFIRIDSRIYFASRCVVRNTLHILLIAIYDYHNEDYNMNVLSYCLGADPVFKLITRVLSFPIPKHPSLEASDFKDVYNGIQISKNGNVSFLLDELEPWQAKYDTCKSMMERNLKDNEYEHYKNNLCALYSMINLIYNKYNPTLSDDSQEAKSALGVMDKATSLFRDGIGSISKIQPEFNFINYYMANHYNDKLTVFHSLEDKELRDEATLSYQWIMNN